MAEPAEPAEPDFVPPARVRLIGQAITRTVARFPWAWPLLRGRVERFFDRLAPDWDERAATAPERMAPLAAALERLPRPPRRILDVGTGTGRAALWLAERYPEAEVLGVDLAPGMVRIASGRVAPDERGRIRFEVADAASLPVPDAGFDLVVLFNVPVFFDELARVLAPGGHVVVLSSLGPSTPFYTPTRTLRSGFRQRGVEEVVTAAVGQGLYFVARRSGSS